MPGISQASPLSASHTLPYSVFSMILPFIHVREIRALSHRYHVEDDSQHSSVTRLLGRHPSRCSPPLFHNHVGVICALAVRTACLASRVTHGLLTEVSTGVPWVLTGTHPCDAPPRQGGGTSERQLVLWWSVSCGASYTVCGICRRYVLYCVLLHPSSR